MRQQDEEPAKPKKFCQSEGQAEILAGASNGLGGVASDSDDEDGASDTEASDTRGAPRSNGAGSFAALEDITSQGGAGRIEYAPKDSCGLGRVAQIVGGRVRGNPQRQGKHRRIRSQADRRDGRDMNV